MDVEHLPAPALITTAAELQRLTQMLSQETIVAVDTESNSLYAYREQVCLIQFSTTDRDYLVDPLALEDLSPLGPIFASPHIEKVFHAAEYDLICMKRDFGFQFNHIFDTMLGARILGWEALGLGSILEQEFGVHLEKRFQRANWGQRPLPSDMLSYARLDTHFLVPLRQRLKAELQAREFWALAQEDFSRMTQVNGVHNGDRQDDCWRVKGAYDLHPQQAAILFELCAYRDQKAQALDRPLFKVIGDQTLLAIAQDAPRTSRQLARLPGMTTRQMQRHSRGLLSAVERGLQSEPLYPPRQPRPSDEYLNRLENLRDWRKNTGLRLGMKSDVVLPRDLMLALARENPTDPAALHAVLEDAPWRLERFGEQILNLLRS